MPFSPAATNSSTNTRVARYSFDWAYNVAGKALESHPRAWEFLGPILGLSKRQIAFLIACNSPEWPYIRSLTHLLSKWLDRCAKELYGKPRNYLAWEGILTGLATECSKCPISPLKAYLTARISQFRLKEQVKKGEERYYRSSSLFAEADENESQPEDNPSQEEP